MPIIDLSHTIINNMQVYPGDQPPILEQTYCIRENGSTNHLLTFGMHTGTHIDGTWHMVDHKNFIADAPLEDLIGKACVIDIRNSKEFTNIQLVKKKAEGCSIVLFYTGYGDLFGSDKYTHDYPLIGTDVAQVIVDMGIKLVGIDTFSPDIEPYKTHQILLSNGIFIAENLTNLHLLLDKSKIEIIAMPLKIEADSAPARIIAVVK